MAQEEEFRVLSVRYEKRSFADQEIIGSINRTFRGKLMLEPSGDDLRIYLREIDLEEFERYVESAVREFNYGRDNIFYSVLEKIRSVRSYGIRAGTRIYAGYDRERKVVNRKEKARRRHIHYYAEGSSFSRKSNELPPEYMDRIVCGDSEEVLRNFPDNSVDLVFTSPPYNFGLEYSDTQDDVDWNEYFDKLFRVLSECIRVLKYGGRIVIDIQPLFSDYIPAHHIVSNFFMKKKMIWRNEILWEKNNYNCKYTAWGSWNSPSSPYMKYTWEFLEVFSKGDIRKPSENRASDLTGEEFKRWVYARWSIAPERNMDQFGHPAMFPEELAMRVIRLFSFRGDVVLDPFNGAGTTTKVAKMYGRHYVGIDISAKYCEIAERRIREIPELGQEEGN
ncbi:hypothetical protein GCM10007108_03230 [Thermogymnomonas acidicola]|uniref:Type II methyltransferase n=1 Tax=Thermogymnomonas acidicola TaxID=399579 RepID=A0AA37BQW8_9ARCH|nr:site-specific DNA-methyltransferase [Thermogymnomonas acidicola]GGM68480.1 hypothetical protein GCM10007108_03230 [Thermogymnomonas acidicola]